MPGSSSGGDGGRGGGVLGRTGGVRRPASGARGAEGARRKDTKEELAALAAVRRWLAWDLEVDLDGWCGVRGETDEGVARKLDAIGRVLMAAGVALRSGDYGDSDLSLRAVAGATRALREEYYKVVAGAWAARSEGSAVSVPGRSAAGARATSVRGQQEGSGRGLAAGGGAASRAACAQTYARSPRVWGEGRAAAAPRCGAGGPPGRGPHRSPEGEARSRSAAPRRRWARTASCGPPAPAAPPRRTRSPTAPVPGRGAASLFRNGLDSGLFYRLA